MHYQSVNPYNGKILKTFEEFTDNQLETAIATAATCFETWRHTPGEPRRRGQAMDEQRITVKGEDVRFVCSNGVLTRIRTPVYAEK